MLRNNSIQGKQMRIIMLTTTAALLLACTGFLAYELFAFRQDMTRNLSSLARSIAGSSTGALTFGDSLQAEQLLENLLRGEPSIVAACIYDEDGAVFAQYQRAAANGFIAPEIRPDTHEFRDNRLRLFRQITWQEEAAGETAIGTVYLESDLQAMRARFKRYGGIVGGVLLGSLLLAFLLSSRLQRLVSGPILHLVEVAEEVSARKNYQVRAAKTADDELGRLIDSFNAMLAQIQERDVRLQEAHDQLEKRVAERTRELHQAYDELRQTQQAVMRQERLRALGKMASGIAHDINNALSPVVVYSELLLRKEPVFDDKARKYLQHILTAGEDIAQIVSRMREFYRPREQNEPLASIDLNRVVTQVIDLTRPRWRDIPQERGIVIKLNTELDPALPPIYGNDSEIREALINLVLNAVDAMPGGGNLSVRSFFIEPGSSTQTRQRVVLEVADSGIGMDEQTRARCLEPFFTTKGQRGTGLGLAMVFGIMERHDAGIEVESEPGKGTLVRLIFRYHALQQNGPLAAVDPPRVDPLKILCIDDDPPLRELVSDMLSAEGHVIVTAEGGREGIDLFRTAMAEGEPFDLVITDLGMPYVDGRQVTATVKRESAATPVVMLTGWGAMMDDDRNSATPVDALLSKPPRIKELRETFCRLAPARSAAGKNGKNAAVNHAGAHP